jgi:hypothetical protein
MEPEYSLIKTEPVINTIYEEHSRMIGEAGKKRFQRNYDETFTNIDDFSIWFFVSEIELRDGSKVFCLSRKVEE